MDTQTISDTTADPVNASQNRKTFRQHRPVLLGTELILTKSPAFDLGKGYLFLSSP
jgi:hypothetical protein